MGIANSASDGEFRASIFEVGHVVRMNQIYRILALTTHIPVEYRKTPEKKMLKTGVRSRNVYENKETKDKVPDEKTDICVDMTRLLQRKAAYDRKSSGSCAETTRGILVTGLVA